MLDDDLRPPLLRFRGWYTANLVVMPHEDDPRAREIVINIGQTARTARGSDRVRVELDGRGTATLIAGPNRLGPLPAGNAEWACAARSQQRAVLTVVNRPIPAEADLHEVLRRHGSLSSLVPVSLVDTRRWGT